MIATDVVLRARRVAEAARRQLDHYPLLDRDLADQLLAAVGQLAEQVAELNRIAFDLECELYYADAAIVARRTAARQRISAGRCAVCGCTDRRACPGGCAWTHPGHTLCSRCARLMVQLAARLLTTRTI